MKRTIYKSSNLTTLGTTVTRHFYRNPVTYPDGVMVEQRIEQSMGAAAIVTSIFIPEDAWQNMIRSAVNETNAEATAGLTRCPRCKGMEVEVDKFTLDCHDCEMAWPLGFLGDVAPGSGPEVPSP